MCVPVYHPLHTGMSEGGLFTLKSSGSSNIFFSNPPLSGSSLINPVAVYFRMYILVFSW